MTFDRSDDGVARERKHGQLEDRDAAFCCFLLHAIKIKALDSSGLLPYDWVLFVASFLSRLQVFKFL
ncbi:hypothetical protein EYF80_042222 [Liparis tanakae]|uniref:Uncharacterized protein n=1 Tax=Liparis tanakae TaxID=230148 RepID=A0A4Z2G363_9TELE|nr:hypothetical protein EYF80_042222 [Liparis tanakae]